MLLSKTLNNLSFWIASEIPRNDVQPLGFASLRGTPKQSRKTIKLYFINNATKYFQKTLAL
jgi:hypothetical protein